MNDEVFEAQRGLAKKAKEHGSGAKEVQNMQKLLAESLTFRVVTVANLLKNKGSGTAGVDNETLTKETTAEQRIELVEWLKKTLRSKKPYKASPVRRVLIPKANGKMRPLGIPTIKDRALQSLLNLVLEPVVELNSDIHSYGYRRFRTAKNALGTLRRQLQNAGSMERGKENKWILDADIKGFFDNISHE
jgi:RNA-directed DNA polymerase